MERLVLFRVGLGLLLLVSIVSLLPYSIAAQNSRDDRLLGESGLPLPRFVAISEKKANMRRGPGEDYPLLYQYRRQGLPMEVVAEYGQWRQVRDHEGSEGWMHARLLRASRHVIIRQAANALPLRNGANAGAGVVALLQSGALARLKECVEAWCEIEAQGYRGWLQRDNLWGVYAFERLD